MARPNFYSDGHTPRVNDTYPVVLKKQLGAAIDAFGDTTPSSEPRVDDTIRNTKEKLNKVLDNAA